MWWLRHGSVGIYFSYISYVWDIFHFFKLFLLNVDSRLDRWCEWIRKIISRLKVKLKIYCDEKKVLVSVRIRRCKTKDFHTGTTGWNFSMNFLFSFESKYKIIVEPKNSFWISSVDYGKIHFDKSLIMTDDFTILQVR